MLSNLQSLVKRGGLFFFFMSLFSVFLYYVGVRQRFMDPAQIMLLRISALSGLVLGVLSVYGIILDVCLLARGRGLRFLPGIALYFIAAVFGILTAVAAIFILVLAGGNRG
jgi:succinate dehydrogenase hydrophobic anchor subunit